MGALSCLLATVGAAVLPLVPYPAKVVSGEGVTQVGEVSVVRDPSLASEGYRLEVNREGVKIQCATAAGEAYARQTLRQLTNDQGQAPCVTIEDAPKFGWRGVLLDESRHFFGLATVKRILDRMAEFKLNVFHWHLVDSHGWRLQLDAYPELTQAGAVRPIPDWDHWIRDAPGCGTYGPYFYTKAEVREIVAYAAARHIRVVPEIEIGGHSREVIICHPGFSCLAPDRFWDMARSDGKDLDQVGAVCLGNDEVIKFYERVLDEVVELFPDEVVHIGGDECPRGNWKQCPKCQRRMREKGLKTEDELQSWVTRYFVDYLAQKGRRAIGWDEILQGGLAPGAIVMSWRGTAGGIAAAAEGHEVVMCPNRLCYLDYPTAVPGDACPYPRFCERTWLPLEKVYSLNPLLGIPKNQHRYILGSESLNWAESTWCEKDLEYKMWPRTCASAEALWTGCRKRKFSDFCARLKKVLSTPEWSKVNVAPFPIPPKPREVPDVLTCEDGTEVVSAEIWEQKRRGEIQEFFEREVYGRRPVGRPADLRFEKSAPDQVMMNGTALRRQLRASWTGPRGKFSFGFTVFLPKAAMDAGKRSPGFLLICNRDPEKNIDPNRQQRTEFWPAEAIVARGYAAITFWNGELAPDDHSPVFTNGVYTLYAPQRGDDTWGALSAWAWGASRVMDWIETESALDARHIAVVGHSRGGKTALVAGVLDKRFAMACVNDSGMAGAKLNHIDLPDSESLASIVCTFPHWFSPRYAKWADKEQEMPYDQHEWMALVAPRLVAIGSADQDDWAGPLGERLSAQLASRVWEELYGIKDGVDYHLRAGVHNLTLEDWNRYMDFADRHGWRNSR